MAVEVLVKNSGIGTLKLVEGGPVFAKMDLTF